MLVVAGPAATREYFKSGDWREDLAWLWKVRPEFFPHIAEHGVWPVERNEFAGAWPEPPGGNIEQWVRGYADNLDRQNAERPRPLPLGWVTLLLAGLLLLAGPADWVVLGWFRRRRWTWVLFPALCVGFAWVSWRLAVHHLGPKARDFTFRLIDLEKDNRVLRETTMRRRIPVQDEEWATETSEGISAALPAAQVADGMGGFDAQAPIPETRSEWLTPSRSILRQNLRQWTWNWRQSVSFAPASLPETPHWEALIARWKGGLATHHEFSARLDGYHVFFSKASPHFGEIPGQVLGADSPIGTPEATMLARPQRPLPDILEAGAPSIAGLGAFSPAARSPLIILAWRYAGDELLVLRRHVSEREIERTP